MSRLGSNRGSKICSPLPGFRILSGSFGSFGEKGRFGFLDFGLFRISSDPFGGFVSRMFPARAGVVRRRRDRARRGRGKQVPVRVVGVAGREQVGGGGGSPKVRGSTSVRAPPPPSADRREAGGRERSPGSDPFPSRRESGPRRTRQYEPPLRPHAHATSPPRGCPGGSGPGFDGLSDPSDREPWRVWLEDGG
jgi:hypothetical protein